MRITGKLLNQVRKNLKKLFYQVSDLNEVIKKLNDNNIEYGIYAGSQVAVLTSNRVPTDVDIIIADKDFEKTKQLFPNGIIKKYKEGDVFLYPYEDKKIEFMFFALLTISNNTYPFRLTNFAYKNNLTVKVNGTNVKMVNPADTIIFKAVMQRGLKEGKHDVEDIIALSKVIKVNKVYIRKRIKEFKAAERVEELLTKYNIL